MISRLLLHGTTLALAEGENWGLATDPEPLS
jgi:hypothetical protein